MKMVWRHSPTGWIGITVIALLFWGVATLQLQRGAAWREGALAFLFFSAFWAGMAGAMVGDALRRLSRSAPFQLAPFRRASMHQALWCFFALVWAAGSLPVALMAGSQHLWWSLPCSLGAAAMGMGLGLAYMGLSMPASLGTVATLVVALMASSGSGLNAAKRIEAVATDTAAAGAGVAACLVAFWLARFLTRRLTSPPRSTAAALMAALPWPVPRLSNTVDAAPSSAQVEQGDSRWLFRPTEPSTGGEKLGLLACVACGALMYYAIAWTDAPSLMVWAYIAAMASMSCGEAAWVSPRLMLLPGGLARSPGMAWRLLRQSFRQRLPIAAALVAGVATTMGLARAMPVAEIAALVSVTLGPLVVCGFAALAATVWARPWVSPRVIAWAVQGLLVAGIWLVGRFGLSLGHGPDSSLWPWAGLSLGLSTAWAGMLWAGIAARWPRFDWGRMPAQPKQVHESALAFLLLQEKRQ